METVKRTVFLFSVIIISASEEVKNLTGTVGGNITLPDPVLEFGFLSYGGKIIAMVNEEKPQILEEIYKNKLTWNRNTGLFTLTDLQRNDTRIYTVDSKKGKVFIRNYQLTVFDSVSAPTVNTLSVSSESCILLCVVEKAEETTLSWYKDEETVKQNSSALSLSLTVHEQDYNSSYRCVAANPAGNKTLNVNVKTSCGQKHTSRSDIQEPRHHVIGVVIPVVSAAIILLAACIIKQKCLPKKPTTTTQEPEYTAAEVEYTDIHIYENRQSQVEHFPEMSGNTQLKTVYDKLEFHRLV